MKRAAYICSWATDANTPPLYGSYTSSNPPPPAPSINGVGQTPTGLLGWFFRSSGHEC